MCYLDFGSEFAFGYILKYYKLCVLDAGFGNSSVVQGKSPSRVEHHRAGEHSGGKSLASSPKEQPNKWNTSFSPVSLGTMRTESSGSFSEMLARKRKHERAVLQNNIKLLLKVTLLMSQ